MYKGFNDVIGSCGISAILSPLRCCKSFFDVFSRSLPLYKISPSVIFAFLGSSCNILIALIVFPHPDSPTNACILPASSEKLTLYNACLNPHSQLKPKFKFFTSNTDICI